MLIEVVAHNIRSMYNVGSIFRNADGFGVSHIYLTGYTATPPRPEIRKVALGAEDAVAWSKESDVAVLVARLKAEGKRIIALEADRTFTDIRTLDLQEPCVLLLGNEPDGLPEDLVQMATDRVWIPMHGTKSSLNVAVASGVALYALRSLYA